MLMMQSQDASLYLSIHTETMVHFVRNADGDEVYFVHQGTGRFETDYGILPYEPGDYVVIPKGTTYRTHVDAGPSLFLLIETRKRRGAGSGPLGQHALFDKGVLVAPELAQWNPGAKCQEWEVHIKRQGTRRGWSTPSINGRGWVEGICGWPS
jgi:homogentisate 1,2-dioxygenase